MPGQDIEGLLALLTQMKGQQDPTLASGGGDPSQLLAMMMGGGQPGMSPPDRSEEVPREVILQILQALEQGGDRPEAEGAPGTSVPPEIMDALFKQLLNRRRMVPPQQ